MLKRFSLLARSFYLHYDHHEQPHRRQETQYQKLLHHLHQLVHQRNLDPLSDRAGHLLEVTSPRRRRYRLHLRMALSSQATIRLAV